VGLRLTFLIWVVYIGSYRHTKKAPLGACCERGIVWGDFDCVASGRVVGDTHSEGGVTEDFVDFFMLLLRCHFAKL